MATYRDVILISENTIKDSLSLDRNVSYEYIAPTTKLVQDIKLQRILGSSLYDSIRVAVLADPDLSEPANSDTKVLVDNYIKDALLYQILAELQVPISFKTRNLGVTQNSDLGTTSTSLADIHYLKNYYQDFAESYEERLIDFLCENVSLYPDYRASSLYGVSPADTSFDSPIALDPTFVPYKRINTPDTNA